jgi:hypothetical protein
MKVCSLEGWISVVFLYRLFLYMSVMWRGVQAEHQGMVAVTYIYSKPSVIRMTSFQINPDYRGFTVYIVSNELRTADLSVGRACCRAANTSHVTKRFSAAQTWAIPLERGIWDGEPQCKRPFGRRSHRWQCDVYLSRKLFSGVMLLT